jgi:nucleoid-associated protein YgaU
MGNEKNNLDDLISSSGGAPIIVQESGGDKKILYILLIALLVLFILAIGLIAFLGGKYFSQQGSAEATVKSAVEAPVKTVAAKSEASQVNKSEVSELEKMVKEEEAKQASQEKVAQPKAEAKAVETKKPTAQEQAIQSAATATTGKALSQDDLAKIAALVAQELAKSKAAAPKSTSAAPKATAAKQDDAALAAALEGAQTDTLKNENTVAPQKMTGNVKAGSNKKVDTFNKVVVGENGGGDDELSKLSQEIDSILQSDEVTKNQPKETVVLKKELKAEAETRQAEMRFIVVKKGDTLSSIANRAYGRASAYTKIYAANPDIVRNPNRIYVGMKLRVPVDEEYKNRQGQ